MHEVGIMEEVLRTAREAAQAAGCRTIHRVVLRVGMFSSVVPEALEFAFEALREGTPAAEATLAIERVGGVSFCPGCRSEFEVSDPIFLCPRCGAACGELRRGAELEVFRVEAS